MLYHADSLSCEDFEKMPAKRQDDRCVNCSNIHSSHFGWICYGSPNLNMEYNNTYLTRSMIDALFPDFKIDHDCMDKMDYHGIPYKVAGTSEIAFKGGLFEKFRSGFSTQVYKPKNVSLAKEISNKNDWRAWAHNVPNDCACGIRKIDCEFHR